MELISYTPATVRALQLPYREIRILPIGDIQLPLGTDTDRLRRYIKWGMANGCYFVGMGDYVDVASPSNRALIGSVRQGLYDSVRRMMDEKVGDYVQDLWDILKPSAGRWFGLLTGHHTWAFEDGTTTETRLAQKLKCPLLGHCAVLALRLGGKDRDEMHRKSPTAFVWLHHGAGGGVTVGASLNKVASNVVPYFFANVYLMAHHHKKAATAVPWIQWEFGPKGKLRSTATTRYIVATGSFLKAYETGSRGANLLPEGGYVEQRMLAPASLGAPVISLRPVHAHSGYSRIDVGVQL